MLMITQRHNFHSNTTDENLIYTVQCDAKIHIFKDATHLLYL